MKTKTVTRRKNGLQGLLEQFLTRVADAAGSKIADALSNAQAKSSGADTALGNAQDVLGELREKLRQQTQQTQEWMRRASERSARAKTEAKKDDPYVILGVSRDDSMDVVKAVWRTKAKFFHPDAGGSKDRMQKLQAAYEAILREKGGRS
jgi:ElaB/YqjD/DUF883 family membrane-anchored ribosome-binding protein